MPTESVVCAKIRPPPEPDAPFTNRYIEELCRPRLADYFLGQCATA